MDNKDLNLLLDKINEANAGDWSLLDQSQFDDPQVAEVMNRLIDTVVARENHFAMRVNDAMIKIADNSTLKTLLDELGSQHENISTLQKASEYFYSIINDKEDFVTKMYALTKEVKAVLDEEAAQCGEIVEKIDRLLPQAEHSLVPELKRLQDDIYFLRNGKLATSMRMRDLIEASSDMYKRNSAQEEGNDLMLSSLAKVLESFVRLNIDSVKIGEHLYQISRDVDNARNAMFRNTTFNLTHDKLKMFAVDHLTLTWRLYNHAMEYESLKITQLNNPDGCKLGLWCQNEMEMQTELSKSNEFKNLMMAHYEFHDCAMACYLLKESFKVEEARKSFIVTQQAYHKLEAAIDAVHQYLNIHGDTAATEVWKFDANAPLQYGLK